MNSELNPMQSVHEPVLLHEVVRELTQNAKGKTQSAKGKTQDAKGKTQDAERKTQDAETDDRIANSVLRTPCTPWYLDGTLGGAGHAKAIAKAYEGHINILGLDRDSRAIERAEKLLVGKVEKVVLVREDFRNLDKVLDDQQIGKVDLILLDLGISSDELETSGRGFSFLKDEPLLMTMGNPDSHPFTARDIVNNWDEEVIADIIFGYGEERFARRIARAIISYRAKKKIETSGEFAELVKSSVPIFYKKGLSAGRYGKIHPATKTFQALRIAVNDELNALREGLKKAFERLNEGGRMGVISFHSLEDRIVKEFFKAQSDEMARIITKKPIAPSAQEVAENPRSRSAKLRVIEKVAGDSDAK